MNDFLYGRFGCKRLPQRIQYGLADMEDLQELFKIQRVHRERLQIADRCGFQIHDLHTQQGAGQNVPESFIVHEKLDLRDDLLVFLNLIKEKDGLTGNNF